MIGWGASYYPEDMLKAYKDIRFTVAGTQVSVSINKYRNNDYPLAKGGTQEAVKIKDAMLALDSRNILARAGGAGPFVNAFTGKGSPDEIATALTLLVDYSDRFIAKFSKVGGVQQEVAAWLADDTLSWQESLQRISDRMLGLDCSGFVGNWLYIFDHSLKINPNTRIKDINAKFDTKRRTSTKKIAAKDLLIWADNSHIAAVDWVVNSDESRFNICQCAGGGPRINEYKIYPMNDGTFTLRGGIPELDRGGAVYAVSLS